MNKDMLMAKLRERLDANYQDYLSGITGWSTQKRQERTNEMQDTEFAYSTLRAEGSTEPVMRYLLHFKDPLRVVAEHLTRQRSQNRPDGVAPLKYALWQIFDLREADYRYELKGAFQIPDRAADELMGEIINSAKDEYQVYFTTLEKLPKAALIQKTAEAADMKRLLSAFIEETSDVPAADLCFLYRTLKPLRAFCDFLYGQEELSALDHFEVILAAFNDKCEEAELLGEWRPTTSTGVTAPLLDAPEDWPEVLQERIDMEYEELEKLWLRMQPSELIEKAQEIAAVQLVRDALTGYEYQDGEVEGLLRFHNPLALAASYWNNSDSPTDEEVWEDLPYVLSSIFENEPEPQEDGQTKGLGLC